MIKEIAWDSAFFKRKIGELIITTEKPYQVKTAVKKAEADGFKYIICKIHSQQTSAIKLLESLNFHLSDIGVTMAIEADRFLCGNMNVNLRLRQSLKVAIDKDIPGLKKISKSLFKGSRFYNDPFFSKKDADNLFKAWIENSVKGKAADVVLCMPDKGFIACRKTKGKKGEIVLIGVKKGLQNKGIGTILTEEAIKWFRSQDVNLVTVRTQLNNINAMNFYFKTGFYIKDYDISFSKIL